MNSSTTEFFISAPDQFLFPVKIEKNDRLLIGDPYPQSNPIRLINEEIVIVDSIRQFQGNTLIKIKGALKKKTSSEQITAFKLGRSFNHFGSNAPPSILSVSNGEAAQSNITYMRPLDKEDTANVNPPIEANEIPLDSVADNLPLGSTIICQVFLQSSNHYPSKASLKTLYLKIQSNSPRFTLIRKITDTKSGSLTYGAISGKASILTLDNNLVAYPIIQYDPFYSSELVYNLMDIRKTQIHEVVDQPLTLKAAFSETTESSGNKLYFLGTISNALNLKNRQIQLAKPGEDVVTANVNTVDPNLSHIQIRKF